MTQTAQSQPCAPVCSSAASGRRRASPESSPASANSAGSAANRNTSTSPMPMPALPSSTAPAHPLQRALGRPVQPPPTGSVPATRRLAGPQPACQHRKGNRWRPPSGTAERRQQRQPKAECHGARPATPRDRREKVRCAAQAGASAGSAAATAWVHSGSTGEGGGWVTAFLRSARITLSASARASFARQQIEFQRRSSAQALPQRSGIASSRPSARGRHRYRPGAALVDVATHGTGDSQRWQLAA